MVQIAILAGGLGTRMQPATYKTPKSMINVYGKPFLEYQIELLKANSIKDIVLCIGNLGEQIKDYFGSGEKFGVKISYSEENDNLLGTAGALKKAENLLENEFFVVYGDSYLPIDYMRVYNHFKKSDKLALDVVYKNEIEYHPNNLAIEGDFVTKYDKENPTLDMEYIDYGIIVFKKEVLGLIPAGQVYSLEAVFKDLIAKKQLIAFETEQRFYELGSLTGLEDFKKYLKEEGIVRK